MERVDYFKLIHKYIPPDSPTYPLYIIHCQLVANKALRIAERLRLSKTSKRFIEEAAMLHDIGIVRTNTPDLFCSGELPYICHIIEGRKILELEGLPRHARVAESHIGVGLTKEDILAQALPLPPYDIFPESLEEEIISFADFFYSKDTDKLWQEKSLAKIRKSVAKRGKQKEAILEDWITRFLKQ